MNQELTPKISVSNMDHISNLAGSIKTLSRQHSLVEKLNDKLKVDAANGIRNKGKGAVNTIEKEV